MRRHGVGDGSPHALSQSQFWNPDGRLAAPVLVLGAAPESAGRDRSGLSAFANDPRRPAGTRIVGFRIASTMIYAAPPCARPVRAVRARVAAGGRFPTIGEEDRLLEGSPRLARRCEARRHAAGPRGDLRGWDHGLERPRRGGETDRRPRRRSQESAALPRRHDRAPPERRARTSSSPISDSRGQRRQGSTSTTRESSTRPRTTSRSET